MATDLNTVTVGGVTYSKADYEAMQATTSTGSTVPFFTLIPPCWLGASYPPAYDDASERTVSLE